MDIVSRQSAITQRLNRYFTGQPCKNGHVAERYLQSSGCVECVHPRTNERRKNRDQRDLAKLTATTDREARRTARTRMVRAKFRVNDCDVAAFQLAVYGASLMREPTLHPGDVTSKWTPLYMHATKRIYAFTIFPQDEPMLRELEVALEREHDVPRVFIAQASSPGDVTVGESEYWGDIAR